MHSSSWHGRHVLVADWLQLLSRGHNASVSHTHRSHCCIEIINRSDSREMCCGSTLYQPCNSYTSMTSCQMWLYCISYSRLNLQSIKPSAYIHFKNQVLSIHYVLSSLLCGVW
ncbi:hypothetical protein NP493_143g04017 [Ridgeia piscesae]|uniref:Uncharacterized protein n=1 Tax=Ridgeia piscesae TaxID=27915 RepID=A0AAD9UG66_RIDPI|nr:hypothetical protein NP493_143g04017 [Ridgeia piscesae]